MQMDKQLLIVLLVGLVIVFIMCSCSKNDKEMYENGAYNPHTLSNVKNNALFAQPQFKADLSPRFDGVSSAGTIYGNPAPIQYQASYITPVSQMGMPSQQVLPQKFAEGQQTIRPVEMFNQPQNVPTNFANMGGSVPQKAAADQYLAEDKISSNQIAHMIGSGTPEYQETSELMPTPDMKGTITVDPADPKNFMYDRTIFSQLKRRYGNGVDFFRGDLQIPQEQRGWFDLMPAAQTDIVTGYFDNYIDIQQTTYIKDAEFERTVPEDLREEAKVRPYGKTYLLGDSEFTESRER
jgi:hypothetical protein